MCSGPECGQYGAQQWLHMEMLPSEHFGGDERDYTRLNIGLFSDCQFKINRWKNIFHTTVLKMKNTREVDMSEKDCVS